MGVHRKADVFQNKLIQKSAFWFKLWDYVVALQFVISGYWFFPSQDRHIELFVNLLPLYISRSKGFCVKMRRVDRQHQRVSIYIYLFCNKHIFGAAPSRARWTVWSQKVWKPFLLRNEKSFGTPNSNNFYLALCYMLTFYDTYN